MHKIVELLQHDDIVVVGVVHDLNLAAKFADKITLLHNGGLLADGKPKEVLTQEFIKEAYRLNPVLVEDQEKESLYLFFE